jgi:hypothetical protein
VSSVWDNRPRRLVAHICDHCRGRFFAPKHTHSQCCSKVCSSLTRQRRVKLICAQCGTGFERALCKITGSKSGLQFCTRLCKDTAQRLEGLEALHPPHYGTAGYNKDQLIRARGHQCQTCSNVEWLSRPIPLEVHHVDGDSSNNADNNLRLLCLNCHGQTLSWRGRNKGRGRQSLQTTGPCSS